MDIRHRLPDHRVWDAGPQTGGPTDLIGVATPRKAVRGGFGMTIRQPGDGRKKNLIRTAGRGVSLGDRGVSKPS